MDQDVWRSLLTRVSKEAGEDPRVEWLAAAGDEELNAVLTAPQEPLWARELAAFRLGVAGDRRAFETLVLLLNHREPARCAAAAHALARLGDPRTARAAAALATNELRVAYALHPVRLLVALRAPEAVPALIAVLERPARPGRPLPGRRPRLRRRPRRAGRPLCRARAAGGADAPRAGDRRPGRAGPAAAMSGAQPRPGSRPCSARPWARPAVSGVVPFAAAGSGSGSGSRSQVASASPVPEARGTVPSAR
ncbi:hypothetical protein SDIAM103S_05114 [Streptomyces diastaticus subsp. diastaticus]